MGTEQLDVEILAEGVVVDFSGVQELDHGLEGLMAEFLYLNHGFLLALLHPREESRAEPLRLRSQNH